MMAGMVLDRFRRRPAATPTPDWARAAATGVAAWEWLDDELRERLIFDTATLAGRLRWEAANGFDLTNDMRATIAAHAALLTLELGLDCYDRVPSIIVHPTVFERAGEYEIGGGIVSDDVVDLTGEANPDGPVIIAWDAALRESRDPDGGRNVVIHEFAHQLDMLDGWVDGTPPFIEGEELERWVEVCSAEFERLRDGDDADGLLDRYAATDPGEFFAVVSELFFTLPFDLAEERPHLYDVFADLYRLDPVGWTEPV